MVAELVSEKAISLGAILVSLGGVCGFLWWLRRASYPNAGTALLVALAWPLWRLFLWLDDVLDVTTLVGMLAPYVVLAIIGFAVGRLMILLSHRHTQSQTEPHT